MKYDSTPIFGTDNPKTGEITRFFEALRALNLPVQEIAQRSGVATRTIMNWVWAGLPLGGKVLRCLHQEGISLDWLLSGSGTMLRTPQVREPHAHYQAEDSRRQRFHFFIDAWFDQHTEDERAWLEVQVKREFPEYESLVSTLTT